MIAHHHPYRRLICAVRTILDLPDTAWDHAPLSNQMRRRVNGKWQHRPKTPAEEYDFEARNVW